MAFVHELPKPTWQGFDPQAVERFAAFVSTTSHLDGEITHISDALAAKQEREAKQLALLRTYQYLQSVAKKQYIAEWGSDTQPDVTEYQRALQAAIDSDAAQILVLDEVARMDLRIESKIVHTKHVQDVIDHAAKQVESLATTIKDLRATIRHLDARLKNLKKLQAHRQQGVSREEIAVMVTYISRLPGVMGLKFDREGIPVIHIRATHARQMLRWDFGDYEFKLMPNEQYEGVLVLKKTRGVKGFYDFDHNSLDWFCFGDRAPELTGLFNTGNYADLFQLLINTLNSVNEGIKIKQLDEEYDRIHLRAVWKTTAV